LANPIAAGKNAAADLAAQLKSVALGNRNRAPRGSQAVDAHGVRHPISPSLRHYRSGTMRQCQVGSGALACSRL
jgi:hypothetical protein